MLQPAIQGSLQEGTWYVVVCSKCSTGKNEKVTPERKPPVPRPHVVASYQRPKSRHFWAFILGKKSNSHFSPFFALFRREQVALLRLPWKFLLSILGISLKIPWKIASILAKYGKMKLFFWNYLLLEIIGRNYSGKIVSFSSSQFSGFTFIIIIYTFQNDLCLIIGKNYSGKIEIFVLQFRQLVSSFSSLVVLHSWS
jgi:hypothetical protein